MKQERHKYFPTVLQAVHLLILYIFIQSLVDFPLALMDYYNDTNYLYNPIKKIILNVGSTLFILIYGFIKSKAPLGKIFPVKLFNPLLIILYIPFFWGVHNIMEEVNILVEKVLPAPPWFWELFNKIFENDYGWWGAFMKITIMAPIVEELIFRGLILQGFRRNYNPFKTVLISAILFSLFHLNPWQMPATFVLGLFLGWIMIRTNSIIAAIMGHSINNLLVLLTVTYWQQINTHAIFLMGKEDKLILSGFVIALSIIMIYWFTLWPINRTKQSK